MNVKIAATATAALLAAGFITTSAAAAPMPQPGPNDKLSADSPTSMSYTGLGKAKVTDANGIRRVVQYEEQFHGTTTYMSDSCVKTVNVTQYYPIDGQKFSVTDCSGNVRSFKFQVTT